jgi:uncharacterized protein
MNFLYAYWNELAGLTIEMAPYLLLGFLFAGLLKVYFPKRLLLKYMGKSNAASAFNASLLGVPMPLCSCGVLPTGISLYRNGASRGSTNSFLISTPQTGIDSILVTYSMLGPAFAVIRPIVALITGFIGGVLTNLGFKNEKHTQTAVMDNEKTPRTVKYMLQYAFVDFLQDISKWLIIGLLIAALIAVILPDDFFTNYITNDFLGMLVILIVTIPIYACATASVPIAAVLMMKGLSPGAALVFLMAGPATNSASFTVLLKTLGKKATLIYTFTIVSGALIFGTLMNLLPRNWFLLSQSHHHGHDHGHFIPYWLGVASAILLVILLINGYYQKYRKKPANMIDNKSNKPGYLTLQLGGMDCNHCVRSVENNIGKLENVEEAKAELQGQKLYLKGKDIDLNKVKETIESLGYQFHDEMPT